MHLTLDLTQILQANKTLMPDGQDAPPRHNVMYPRFPISLTFACITRLPHAKQPQAHKPRSSRSCASIPVASGNRGVISTSNGTGRLRK